MNLPYNSQNAVQEKQLISFALSAIRFFLFQNVVMVIVLAFIAFGSAVPFVILTVATIVGILGCIVFVLLLLSYTKIYDALAQQEKEQNINHNQ